MPNNNTVNILGDIGLQGSLRFLKNNEAFPENPTLGTLLIKENNMFAYIRIGELDTWYPFNSRTRSYIHTQGVPALTWTVNHNLGSNEIWYQVYDTTGLPLFASRTNVNANTFTINLTEATTGTVVIVAPDDIDVPIVKAQTMTIGEGSANVTTIDTSGIRVNGNYVLTSATVQPLSSDLTAIDALVGNSGFLKKTGLNTWELDTNTYLIGNQNISFTGDATGSGTTSVSLTLSNTGVTAGTYKSVTVDAKGRVTAGTNPTTLAGYGITDAVNSSSLGVANGVATLDSAGKVPSSQLPSYVDDIEEYATEAAFPATGETGKIYVDKSNNTTHRWTGSAYIEVSSGISSFNELSGKPTTLDGYGITDAATSANATFTGTYTNNASVRSKINTLSAFQIDCSLGNFFIKSLNGDATLSFANVPSGVAYSCTLRVELVSGIITWPASITWPQNAVPSLSTGKIHLFVFITENGGTSWRAAALTNYTP